MQIREMPNDKRIFPNKISMVKQMNNRRALSTVVTSAIMLTAVAVIGSSIVVWSNTNLRTFESSLSNMSATNTNKINEKLLIEDVNFCQNCYPTKSPKTGVNITLTNVGTLTLKIKNIQMNNNTLETWSLSPTINILASKSFTYNHSYNWHSNLPVTITVTTSRGSTAATQVVPP